MISRHILSRRGSEFEALARSPHGAPLQEALGECRAEMMKDLSHADLANVVEAARIQGAIQTLDTLAEYLVPSR